VATDEKMVEGIQMRLAAVPQGEWHSSLGSGHCVMTAVMSDIPSGAEDYETVFICDVLPDYRVEDSQAWKNRSPLLDLHHKRADRYSLFVCGVGGGTGDGGAVAGSDR